MDRAAASHHERRRPGAAAYQHGRRPRRRVRGDSTGWMKSRSSMRSRCGRWGWRVVRCEFVARVKRSETGISARVVPDCASLHPGYALFVTAVLDFRVGRVIWAHAARNRTPVVPAAAFDGRFAVVRISRRRDDDAIHDRAVVLAGLPALSRRPRATTPSRRLRPLGCHREINGAPIGFGGIYEDPFDPGWGVEVGYFLAPAAWGKGYATEFTRFCVALARLEARWPALNAFVHPKNIASQNVLLKSGFRQERFVPEMQRFLYRLDLCSS